MKVKKKRRSLIVITALVGVMALSPVVFASSGESQQISNLRVELERLAENDQGEVGKEEIEGAQKWLDEAEELLSQRAHRQVEYRLRRADHMVDLIQALIEVGNLEAATEVQQQRYQEARGELERLKEEIRELEARKAERERQLRELRGQ